MQIGVWQLSRSVPQVPTYEEYFGLDDNEIKNNEWDSDEEDEQKRKLIILALSILEAFYLDVQYYSAYDVLTEDFEAKINQFNSELKDSLHDLFKQYISELESEYNMEYNIPNGYVDNELDINPVLDEAVDNLTSVLSSDLRDKATFYKELAVTTGVFALHSNFRRAIRKLSNTIKWDSHHVGNVIERNYLEFVYGQDAPARWITAGRNTCEWCYMIEGMGIMPLSWFPVDHVNGHCHIEIVYPDQYSEVYQELQGWKA